MGEGGLSTPEEGDMGEGADGGIGHKTQVRKKKKLVALCISHVCCEATDWTGVDTYTCCMLPQQRERSEDTTQHNTTQHAWSGLTNSIHSSSSDRVRSLAASERAPARPDLTRPDLT